MGLNHAMFVRVQTKWLHIFLVAVFVVVLARRAARWPRLWEAAILGGRSLAMQCGKLSSNRQPLPSNQQVCFFPSKSWELLANMHHKNLLLGGLPNDVIVWNIWGPRRLILSRGCPPVNVFPFNEHHTFDKAPNEAPKFHHKHLVICWHGTN